jgi:copper(I)-binding protein
MIQFRRAFGVVAAVGLLLAFQRTNAHAYDVGALHIGHPWIRPMPNGALTAAGYLTVSNHGKVADRLLGGTSPLAASITPHTMSMTDGIMRMRELPGGYEIPPGGTLTLSPMGNHLMLIGPKRTFKAGDHIPATLRFAHAGPVKVEFVVQADPPDAGPSKPPMDMH